MLCNFFVSENYLGAKNNFLQHLEKWLWYLLYNWRPSYIFLETLCNREVRGYYCSVLD